MNATKSREVIWGGRIGATKISAEQARKRAIEAVREADRAEAHAWSLRMEGFGGPLWRVKGGIARRHTRLITFFAVALTSLHDLISRHDTRPIQATESRPPRGLA